MGGSFVIGGASNVLRATITATGTLTNEIDLSEYLLNGIIASGATNGTINFQVSAYPDAAVNVGYTSSYTTLYDDLGTAVAITLPTGTSAIGADKLRMLAGYRYVKIKTTPAQTTGALFLLPVRA